MSTLQDKSQTQRRADLTLRKRISKALKNVLCLNEALAEVSLKRFSGAKFFFSLKSAPALTFWFFCVKTKEHKQII